MGSSIAVSGDVNNKPIINLPSEVYTSPYNYIYIEEGSTDLLTISASDADGDNLVYSLSGNDAGKFNISSSGKITFVEAPVFNTTKEFDITIIVSDSKTIVEKPLVVFIDRTCSDELIGYEVCFAAEFTTGYDRDKYQDNGSGWDDWDLDCQNNRQEVLIAEHLSDQAQLTWRSSVNGPQCLVDTGRWYDPFDDKYFTSYSQVQIDHFIPLAESDRSGAYLWTDRRKRLFGNDINIDEYLIAVGGASNSAKSDSDPSEWMPDNTSYHCQYLKDWVKVKSIYKLAINATERSAIESDYASCESSQPETINVSFEANSNGQGNVYVIDGVQKKSLTLEVGKTYTFNHSSSHPLRLSTTSNGTHGGGNEYTSGVTKSSGTTTIEVTTNTPATLYYYCSLHPGMGADITVTNS